METTVWTVLGALETVLCTVETADWTGVGEPDPDPDPVAGVAGPFTAGLDPADPEAAAAGVLEAELEDPDELDP